MKTGVRIAAAVISLYASVSFADRILIAGWDGSSPTTNGFSVAAPGVSGSLTMEVNGGYDAVFKTGSSLSGQWAGDAALTPTPSVATSDVCVQMRAFGATGTNMPYMDLTITNSTGDLSLTHIAFDIWLNWGSYGNDILVYYQGGDLAIASNTLLRAQAEVQAPAGNADSTADVGINVLDIGSLLSTAGDMVLGAGETATFRVYHGSTGGGELRHDNIAVLGYSGAVTDAYPPDFVSANIVKPDGFMDIPYSDTLADSAGDINGDPLTFAKLDGPDWLTVSGTGTLGGTPLLADAGTNTFLIEVSNNGSNPTNATLQIKVIGTNTPPTFTSDPIKGIPVIQDTVYSNSIAGNATDVDGDTLTFSNLTASTWLSVAPDGTLSGTPSSSDLGTNSFTVMVDDGNGGTDTATLEILVAAPIPEYIIAGWDAGAGNATIAAAGVTGTLMINGGSGGGDAGTKYDGSSLSGKWGGYNLLLPPPGDTGKCAMMRANGATATNMPYMDLSITAGAQALTIKEIAFDMYKYYGAYGNDILVYYMGGDLVGVATNLPIIDPPQAEVQGTESGTEGSIADPALNILAIGSALADNTLAAGESATFRIYHGSSNGGEMRYDNIVIVGTTQTGLSAFQVWQNLHFDAGQRANPGISGPSAAPSNDGIPNLVKYALNLDPWVAGGINTGSVNAGNWLIGFDRNPDATDVNLYLDMTGNLAAGPWNPIATSLLGGGVTVDNGATLLQDNAGGTTGAGVQVSVPLDTRSFFRFRAEQQ